MIPYEINVAIFHHLWHAALPKEVNTHGPKLSIGDLIITRMVYGDIHTKR